VRIAPSIGGGDDDGGEDAALATHASSIATLLPRECERLVIILAAEAMLGG
jgi:hypothetical protein